MGSAWIKTSLEPRCAILLVDSKQGPFNILAVSQIPHTRDDVLVDHYLATMLFDPFEVDIQVWHIDRVDGSAEGLGRPKKAAIDPRLPGITG
jgi:hypothetical protein